MSKKKKGSFDNVFPIQHAREKIDLELYCSICKEKHVQTVKWNTDIDKIRCLKCVNPVDLVYPKETE